MRRYLAYLKGKEVNGLITYGLGDWMAPAGDDVPNMEGAVYVYDTGLMRDIAWALGKTDDSSAYAQDYTRVCDAYNRAYFNPKSKSYQPVNQANEAIPLVFGIVPEGDVESVRQALVDDIAHPQEIGSPPSSGRVGDFGPVVPNHISAGDIATSAVWQALGDADQGTLVQTMIMAETPPSYLYLIKSGATTISENWDYEKTRSHNHDMYAGILAYLYRNVGGISALKPGYELIQIKPFIPIGLNSASVTYNSIRGPIESSWLVDGKELTLKVRIPANATAIVTVPTVDANSVREGDQAAKDALGVKFLRYKSSAAVFAVGSGAYVFESKVATPTSAATP
jgi:alpha-L-rhamnosidase